MQFRDVELEIVRPGPPHGQPLNELTQYMALCGENSPITFTMPFEHEELLSRMDHLRYFVESDDGTMVRIGARARESTLSRLGVEVGALLNDIRSLGTELASVRPENWRRDRDDDQIAHLRIVVSGSELAILPLELSIAPAAMPGEGQELFLQSRVQVVPTREIRRSRPLSTRLSDFSRPRVLFVYAAPGTAVPARDHLRAIRSSLDLLLGQRDPVEAEGESERGDEIKEYLRVLPDASLADIERICERERFSHVHILAHGATYREAGQTRWGVALCAEGSPNRPHVVSGKRLAHALSVETADRNGRSAPFWVTLASCDSGNPGSVMVPGGSIAHELHTSGIPWVLASQFPLSIPGSVHLTRLLYDRLFAGDDPRQALYETRKRLFIRAKWDHDWASMITYASVPDDFAADVAQFYASVTEQAVNRTMSHIDDLFATMSTATHSNRSNQAGQAGQADGATDKLDAEIDAEFRTVNERLDQWEKRISRAGGASRDHMTLFHGIKGSVNKRMAIHRAELQRRSERPNEPSSEPSPDLETARAQMIDARRAYKNATDQWAFDTNYYNWVASQYLSTTAVLGLELDRSVKAIFDASTKRTIEVHSDPAEKMWAKASLAEGILLDFIDERRPAAVARMAKAVQRRRAAQRRAMSLSSDEADADDAASEEEPEEDTVDIASIEPVEAEMAKLLEEVVNTMGRDSFHVESTRRQFQRYVENFAGLAWFDKSARALAERAVVILAPDP